MRQAYHNQVHKNSEQYQNNHFDYQNSSNSNNNNAGYNDNSNNLRKQSDGSQFGMGCQNGNKQGQSTPQQDMYTKYQPKLQEIIRNKAGEFFVNLNENEDQLFSQIIISILKKQNKQNHKQLDQDIANLLEKQEEIKEYIQKINQEEIFCRNNDICCQFSGSLQQYKNHLKICDYEFCSYQGYQIMNIALKKFKQRGVQSLQNIQNQNNQSNNQNQSYNNNNNNSEQSSSSQINNDQDDSSYNQNFKEERTLLVANFPKIGMVELFKKFGELDYFSFQKNDKNLIFFAKFSKLENAQRSLEQLDHTEIQGRTLRVTFFRPKQDLQKFRVFVKGLQTNNVDEIKDFLQNMLKKKLSQVSLLNQYSSQRDASAFVQVFDEEDAEFFKKQSVIQNSKIGKKVQFCEYKSKGGGGCGPNLNQSQDNIQPQNQNSMPVKSSNNNQNQQNNNNSNNQGGYHHNNNQNNYYNNNHHSNNYEKHVNHNNHNNNNNYNNHNNNYYNNHNNNYNKYNNNNNNNRNYNKHNGYNNNNNYHNNHNNNNNSHHGQNKYPHQKSYYQQKGSHNNNHYNNRNNNNNYHNNNNKNYGYQPQNKNNSNNKGGYNQNQNQNPNHRNQQSNNNNNNQQKNQDIQNNEKMQNQNQKEVFNQSNSTNKNLNNNQGGLNVNSSNKQQFIPSLDNQQLDQTNFGEKFQPRKNQGQSSQTQDQQQSQQFNPIFPQILQENDNQLGHNNNNLNANFLNYNVFGGSGNINNQHSNQSQNPQVNMSTNNSNRNNGNNQVNTDIFANNLQNFDQDRISLQAQQSEMLINGYRMEQNQSNQNYLDQGNLAKDFSQFNLMGKANSENIAYNFGNFNNDIDPNNPHSHFGQSNFFNQFQEYGQNEFDKFDIGLNFNPNNNVNNSNNQNINLTNKEEGTDFFNNIITDPKKKKNEFNLF